MECGEWQPCHFDIVKMPGHHATVNGGRVRRGSGEAEHARRSQHATWLPRGSVAARVGARASASTSGSQGWARPRHIAAVPTQMVGAPLLVRLQYSRHTPCLAQRKLSAVARRAQRAGRSPSCRQAHPCSSAAASRYGEEACAAEARHPRATQDGDGEGYDRGGEQGDQGLLHVQRDAQVPRLQLSAGTARGGRESSRASLREGGGYWHGAHGRQTHAGEVLGRAHRRSVIPPARRAPRQRYGSHGAPRLGRDGARRRRVSPRRTAAAAAAAAAAARRRRQLSRVRACLTRPSLDVMNGVRRQPKKL